MPPALLCVDHIHVYVSNRRAALEWYAKVLNFTPIKELEFWATNAQEPLTIGSPDGVIRLALFEDEVELCRSTIAFGATGAEFLAWHAHLEAMMGTPIEIFDHEVTWSLYFFDPDGNPFEMTTHDYAHVASQIKQS